MVLPVHDGVDAFWLDVAHERERQRDGIWPGRLVVLRERQLLVWLGQQYEHVVGERDRFRKRERGLVVSVRVGRDARVRRRLVSGIRQRREHRIWSGRLVVLW